MAIYELGKIGLNLRGNYDASANYSKLDVVSYNGSSYVALESCAGVIPDSQDATNKWMMLAQGAVDEPHVEVLSFDVDSKFDVRSDHPLAPTIRVANCVVELQGEMQPLDSITGGTAYWPICTIPPEYAPHHDVCVLQQGSTQQIWMLRIYGRNNDENTIGKVMFTRCRSGNAWSNVTTSTWLPFHATWIV